jgi:hypothetical protein
MSNYPAGAENDPHAPFNRKELQGQEIGLFEYLENLEMPYEVRKELQKFEENRIKTIKALKIMEQTFKRNMFPASEKLVIEMQKNLNEPQIFIEE